MKSIASYSLSELLEIKEIIENEELRKKIYQEIERKNNDIYTDREISK